MTGLIVVVGCIMALAVWVWSSRGLEGEGTVALVAVLGALAATFNTIVPIANVEASMTIVVCCSIALGARAGCATGIVAVLGTSATASFGPWTLWQVVATCTAAVIASAIRPALDRAQSPWSVQMRLILGLLVLATTLIYDVIVTIPTQLLFNVGAAAGQSAAERVVSALIIGAPYTLVHCAATVGLTMIAGPALVHALNRAAIRLPATGRRRVSPYS